MDEWMDGWMNEWMDECMNGWMNAWMNAWMNKWMNGWMNKWMNEWMDGWMNGWMNAWMDGWMNGWMHEWMDEWMDEWMNEWMNAWMNGCMDGWMHEWMHEWKTTVTANLIKVLLIHVNVKYTQFCDHCLSSGPLFVQWSYFNDDYRRINSSTVHCTQLPFLFINATLFAIFCYRHIFNVLNDRIEIFRQPSGPLHNYLLKQTMTFNDICMYTHACTYICWNMSLPQRNTLSHVHTQLLWQFICIHEESDTVQPANLMSRWRHFPSLSMGL